ncbi:MAG: DUF948 domain-containing protein [Desulfobacteraceae bacterium]|nr:MAG: DUF948 domain-containing protein [Desulfobacteraceae bacterium]
MRYLFKEGGFMPDPYWTAMLSIGIIVVAITFLAAVFLLIYSFIQIKRAATALTDFLAATDSKLNPLLKEAEETLKSIRAVSDDIGSATSNIRNISGALSNIALQVRIFGLLTEGLQNLLSDRITGLKAGIKAALDVLLNKEKKGGE